MSKLSENKTENLEGGTGILVGERKLTPLTFLMKYNALLILAVLIIVSAVISPIFLTWSNVINVFRQQSTYLIIAMGMLMCMLTGGIDLSSASVAGLGSILITHLSVTNGMNIVPAILLSLLVCAAIGAINGFLVAYLDMAPFIVTLAMSYGVQGLVYILTKGMNIMLPATNSAIQAFLDFGQNSDPLLGIPYRVYLTILLVAFFWFLLRYTSFGRLSTATGSNPVAVALAGINIKKYRMSAFVICSSLAGAAGVLLTAANGSSSPATTGGDYAMIGIAGTILGGADLGGGKGSVVYTVVGVFIMGLINNIMNLMNVPSYPQWVVKAVVIILAVFMRSVINKKK